MAEYLIALGSNLGNRERYMQKAAAFLESISDKPILKSSLYETEAVGNACTHPFLNAVVCLESSLMPVEMLTLLKKFESDTGRNQQAPRWSDRIIDLDIIACDESLLNTKELILPHPRYHQRLFVLIPLAEIKPDWHDPLSRAPVEELKRNSDKISVSKTSLNW